MRLALGRFLLQYIVARIQQEWKDRMSKDSPTISQDAAANGPAAGRRGSMAGRALIAAGLFVGFYALALGIVAALLSGRPVRVPEPAPVPEAVG